MGGTPESEAGGGSCSTTVLSVKIKTPKVDYPREGRDDWRRYVPSWRLVAGSIGALIGAAVVFFGVLFVVTYIFTDIPEVNEVAEAQTSIVYWSDGESEIARLGDTNRISVPLSQVPEDVRYAVLAAEDRRFYEHSGFDVIGIMRAMWNNLTSDSTSGGSTITQQLAKNAFLSSEQTYIRKFKEAVLTVKLEVELSKDEILEHYFNVIFYGRSAYGVQTAAEAYFGVESKDLTLEQGAVLASVINAPGRYNPDDPEGLANLEDRYVYVLNGMVEEEWLTAAERDEALGSFPEFAERKQDQRYEGPDGYLLRAVQDELEAKGFTQEEIEAGGLRIVSTFTEQAQDAALAAVEAEGPTSETDGLRIGLAAVTPGTGEVVAMYGGADYLANSLNNATQAIQQAGSTFKPFGLAAATEDGIGLDSQWPGNNGTVVAGYTVNNYAGNSYGSLVSLLTGTEQSINTVYVSVENETGVEPVQQAAVRAGIPEDTVGMNLENPDLTFVLGTASPHTIDIASSYATFAARGERAATTTVRSVRTSDGSLRYEHASEPQRTFDENTADVVNYALRRVVTNGTGGPAQGLGRPAAGKTGSTDEYMSAWFAGYVPQLATAVSFSKDDADGNPVSLSGTGGQQQFFGSGYPARIWTAFMQGALEGTDVVDFVEPAELPSGGGVDSGSAGPTAPDRPAASDTPEPTSEPEPTEEPEETEEPEPPAESAEPPASEAAP